MLTKLAFREYKNLAASSLLGVGLNQLPVV
jgi:hypothetical protein